MKCVGYDAEWIGTLISDYPAWLEQRVEKLKANASKRKKQKHLKKPRVGANTSRSARANNETPGRSESTGKRKLAVLDASTEDESSASELEVMDEGNLRRGEGRAITQEPVYVPKGTRSRPNIRKSARMELRD